MLSGFAAAGGVRHTKCPRRTLNRPAPLPDLILVQRKNKERRRIRLSKKNIRIGGPMNWA